MVPKSEKDRAAVWKALGHDEHGRCPAGVDWHEVDVRTVPRSRHNPQFNQDALPDALAAAGIGYTAMKGLGGWRTMLSK